MVSSFDKLYFKIFPLLLLHPHYLIKQKFSYLIEWAFDKHIKVISAVTVIELSSRMKKVTTKDTFNELF